MQTPDPESLETQDNDAPTGTRAALIAAGLTFFGQKGYAAASTREIAAMAETNIASIAYHFGGKDGLHAACTAEVARRLSRVAELPTGHEHLAREQATAILEALIRTMVTFLLTGQKAGDLVAFILREMTTGEGSAIDALYERLFERKHREICRLWAAATGMEAESAATRLAVFAALGQAVYFRIGLPVVSRRMGWEEIGPDEARAVADTVAANLRTAIERSRT